MATIENSLDGYSNPRKQCNKDSLYSSQDYPWSSVEIIRHKKVSEGAELTNKCSVVKGINFHIEKILPVHIGMQNVRLSICVSVCL